MEWARACVQGLGTGLWRQGCKRRLVNIGSEGGMQKRSLGWEGKVWGVLGQKKGMLSNKWGLERRCRIWVAGCTEASRFAQSGQAHGTGKGPQRGERQKAGGRGEAVTGSCPTVPGCVDCPPETGR